MLARQSVLSEIGDLKYADCSFQHFLVVQIQAHLLLVYSPELFHLSVVGYCQYEDKLWICSAFFT